MLEMENTVTEMKNASNRLVSRLGTTEERLCARDNISSGSSQKTFLGRPLAFPS